MATVAVDTNLLLLLIVGSTRKDFICRHKRLKSYTERDFELIAQTLRNVDVIISTPNVMTEVSNLLVQGVLEPLRSELLSRFVSLSAAMDERYHPCGMVMEDPAFVALGLSDAAWLCILKADSILVTDDRDLSDQAFSRGLQVVTLAALRDQAQY